MGQLRRITLKLEQEGYYVVFAVTLMTKWTNPAKVEFKQLSGETEVADDDEKSFEGNSKRERHGFVKV